MSNLCLTSTLPVTKTGVYPINAPSRNSEGLTADAGCRVAAQTGALLVVLGSLLLNLYPLREHVDPRTGEMLVKIGRKLTGG